MHIFGEYDQWGITVDDGCLRFHPDVKTNPKATARHIWREAFEEVEKLGGFDAAKERIRGKTISGVT